MAIRVIKWKAKDGSEYGSEVEADLRDMKNDLIEKISEQDCTSYGSVSVGEIADIILNNREDILSLINFYRSM